MEPRACTGRVRADKDDFIRGLKHPRTPAVIGLVRAAVLRPWHRSGAPKSVSTRGRASKEGEHVLSLTDANLPDPPGGQPGERAGRPGPAGHRRPRRLATFAAIRSAGLDLLTYRKGPFDRLPDTAFAAHTFTDPDGQVHSYRLAETTVELPLSNRTGGSVALREIHRQAVDGTQIPVLTSRTDLPAAEVCWRLSARWRQENYFKWVRLLWSEAGAVCDLGFCA